jgi:hypothetical protein
MHPAAKVTHQAGGKHDPTRGHKDQHSKPPDKYHADGNPSNKGAEKSLPMVDLGVSE